MKKDIYDSLGILKSTDSQTSYYCKYWDPEVNSQSKKLVDIVLTQLSSSEIELKFTEAIMDTISGQIRSFLVQNQRYQVTQFGKITSFPNLKSHWYHLSTFYTKLEDRDLGIYYQITHFFIWSGRTFSVTFNFDHSPSDLEMSEIQYFLMYFGEKRPLHDCSQLELIEFKGLLEKYYSLGYEALYGFLSEDEKNQVLSCAVEKIRQIYTCDELMNGTIDTDEFDEITTGCIEFIKL